MAQKRRSPSRRGKKSRGLLWLMTGLLLGVGVMWAAQHFYYRDSKPFTGFANLLSAGKKLTANSEKPGPVVTETLPKPKLDFYTILPGETVLPEPRGGGKKTARADSTETGYSYLLQAAAFSNSADADQLKAKLVLNGLEPRIEKITAGDKGIYYRVRLGPYSRLEDLDATNAKLGNLGIRALRIKVKKNAG